MLKTREVPYRGFKPLDEEALCQGYLRWVLAGNLI